MFDKLFKKKEELPELPDISELDVPEPMPITEQNKEKPKREKAKKKIKKKEKEPIFVGDLMKKIDKVVDKKLEKKCVPKESKMATVPWEDLVKKIDEVVDKRVDEDVKPLKKQVEMMKKVKGSKDADQMMMQMFDTVKRLGDEFVSERKLRDKQYKELRNMLDVHKKTMHGALSGVRKELGVDALKSDVGDVIGVTDQLTAEIAYKDEEIKELNLRIESMKQELESMSDILGREKIEEDINRKIEFMSDELKSLRRVVMSKDYSSQSAAFEAKLKEEFEHFRNSVPDLEKVELFTVRQELIENKIEDMKSKVDSMNVKKMNAIVSRLGKVVTELSKKKKRTGKKKK